MAKMTSDELLAVFEEMTVLELKEFLDAFEEKFDVTAAAPVAVAAAPAGGGDDAGAAEKDSFDVVLAEAGSQKIQVIKEVRGLTSLGLKEAKELVDGAPSDILTGASKEDADKAGTILPLVEFENPLAEEEHKQIKQFITQRQTERLWVVGSSNDTAELIDHSKLAV